MKNTPRVTPLLLDQGRVFHQSFLQASQSMMICDADWRIRFVNRAFSQLYGYAEDEAVGRVLSILQAPETPGGGRDAPWAAALEQGREFWKGEVRHRTKNGHAAEVLLTISPLRNENGQNASWLCVSVDISEQKLIEKNLGQQEKLSSIGLLASGIAHEIGSPLNVISGRAEMVKQSIMEISPETAGSLDIIIQQTDRISELIKALLNFSHPSPLSSPQNFTDVDLMEVLTECRKLLRKPLKDLGAAFSVHADGPARVHWDFHKAEQVFINLLQNALHAVEGKHDGAIEVNFRRLTGPEAKELGVPRGRGLALEITDNGTGIPEEYQTRIFDPFFTTKDVGMGTGLGLSVVYGLLQETKGTVSVKSEKGKGATFTILLRTP